ncbi:MAG: RagB/SusD family nutrient uptake outer membrane protein [Prevotellaceae bacterium]|nr:RagB/SusD family nutrient uptake outer membrane protein [Prevotellaceae bacterium]
MKKIYCIICMAALLAAGGCKDFLDRESENLLTDDQVFSDENMINAVLANYYGRIDWGQRIDDHDSYMATDEAANSGSGGWTWGGSPYEDGIFRVYDYTLIRHINQFLESIRSEATAGLSEDYRKQLEGEVRFIRAWTYFNMGRCMGGMPLVGDEVFEYSGGTDITALQFPRSTEAELYDYVISECTEIADMLPTGYTKNAARANKWAALTLKARAAIYAASIAKYGNSVTPDVRTSDYTAAEGGAVGIPASKANGYHQTALAAAEEIITNGRYRLYNEVADKGVNFYEAVCNKASAEIEVIWAKDHIVPGNNTGFTNANGPLSMAQDADANRETAILNLVEAFEYTNDRNGTLKTRTSDASDYIYYDNPEDLFAGKDARLYGSVIYSGADWNGTPIIYQAGQMKWSGSSWTIVTSSGQVGTVDEDGDMVVSIDGPNQSDGATHNNTGFNIRKFMDYKPTAFTRGAGSDMWFVRMRYAEVLLIAAEAAMELNDNRAVGFINQVRDRAGIQPLSAVTLADIEQERRVEFAYENHRWWDLKRWRRAHVVWPETGTPTLTDDVTTHNQSAAADVNTSVKYALFPYRIKSSGHAQDGKWVFDKVNASGWTYSGRRQNFQLRHYYNFLDNGWLEKNPKLVRNPYQ